MKAFGEWTLLELSLQFAVRTFPLSFISLPRVYRDRIGGVGVEQTLWHFACCTAWKQCALPKELTILDIAIFDRYIIRVGASK
jgi:hypothetical protein